MSSVILDMTVSLDGLVAAPGDDVERLQRWKYDGEIASKDGAYHAAPSNVGVIDEQLSLTGAFVMGRRTYDLGAARWGDDPPFHVPCFVVTHRPHDPVHAGDTTFAFVDGIATAIEHARAAAGDKHVTVIGGANVAQQVLAAGLADEVLLHEVPIVLGAGSRLFDPQAAGLELERTRIVAAPDITHLRYRVVRHADTR